VVVRLLAPTDYGIAGLALAVVAAAAILSEFGFGTALVALREITPRQVAQLNGAALLLSFLVAALLALSAPAFASFYHESALRAVLPALSVTFLAEGARLVPVALLSRQLRYRATAMLDFGRVILTASLVLPFALAGFKYWALVLGNIGGAVLTSLWILLRYGQPVAWPRLAELREPIRFGRQVLVARLAWVLYRNSDFFVAGRIFGTTLLGFYTMAWNVASLPGEKLGNVLTAATAPFFAAIQHDRAVLRHYFLRVTGALALVLFPVLFGFLCVADLAIPVVLGARWLPAVPALRALVFYSALQAVTTPVNQILNVTGNTRTAMWAGLLALAILPPAFVVGGKLGGITGIGVAWVVAYPVIAALPLSKALRALGLPVGEYLLSARYAIEGVLVMVVAVLAVRALPWSAPGAGELGVAVLVGGLAYLGTLWMRQRELLLSVPRLLKWRQDSALAEHGPTPRATV
jgi:teichuronic acid exporter